jgi:hypothetical protein
MGVHEDISRKGEEEIHNLIDILGSFSSGTGCCFIYMENELRKNIDRNKSATVENETFSKPQLSINKIIEGLDVIHCSYASRASLF